MYRHSSAHFSAAAVLPCGQVALGEGLADRDVVGVVGGDHRQVVQKLRRVLLAEVDPRQAGDPLGVIRVVLAGQLVELLGLVKLARLHLQLGEQVDDPFVGPLGVERRLEQRQRSVVVADRDAAAGP